MKIKSEITKITAKDIKDLYAEFDIHLEKNWIKEAFTEELMQEIRNNELFKNCKPLSEKDITSNIVQLQKIEKEDRECKLSSEDVCPFDGYHLSVYRNIETNFLEFNYRVCKKLEQQILYRENNKKFLYNSYALLKQFPILEHEKETSNSKNVFLKNFLDIWNNNLKHGLYIYGKQGVGKTHLFKLICNKIITSKKTQKTVALINLVDLVETVKTTFSNKNNPKYLKLMQAINQADYLFLDDLGAEFATDWFYSNNLLNILDNRLATNKPTFFNSNLDLNGYHKRILKNCKNKDNDVARRIIVRIERLVQNKIIEIKDPKFV